MAEFTRNFSTLLKFIQGGMSKPSCFSIRMQSHSHDHTELGRNGKLDRREDPETRLMNMKGIDLIHDTRHLFPRSRIDGIKIVSRGISGGKQGLKFAYTSNQSQFCSLFQNKNTILVLQNVWFEFPQVLRHYCLLSGHLRSLLLQKKLTMITSTHNLPLSSLRFFVV